MSECTCCPPNTKQCAHFDGHWVRLDYAETSEIGTEYGVFWSWPPKCSITGFFSSNLSIAEGWFQEMNVEMRKFAREEYGDEST